MKLGHGKRENQFTQLAYYLFTLRTKEDHHQRHQLNTGRPRRNPGWETRNASRVPARGKRKRDEELVGVGAETRRTCCVPICCRVIDNTSRLTIKLRTTSKWSYFNGLRRRRGNGLIAVPSSAGRDLSIGASPPPHPTSSSRGRSGISG